MQHHLPRPQHHLPRPQHLTPHDGLMASSGFFNLCATHFPCGSSSGCGFAAPSFVLNDYGLLGEIMQLGAGGVSPNSVVGTVADGHQAWQYCDGGYSHDPPSAFLSLDGDGDGNPARRGKQGVASDEAHGDDDGNVLGTRKRRDRAKTIVLERKRRVRMQETLYELRSLVPNITKMDKASIIADAVDYVKNLQAHAVKLQEEVAALEAPPRSSYYSDRELQHDRGGAANKSQEDDDSGSIGSSGSSHGARVTRVGATRVGEGRFFVTVECERRDGAAAHLVAAVESLACFRVESSSLGRSAPDRLVSTATLKATCQVEAATIGEATVKLLMMAALGEGGFTVEATAWIS
ncbi:hypothetical protein QOZ80_4BG0352070 [Eleusine coracana subsp. coracana]|nr:hypothetical protein QOZ80_4BG0352070 [Eleusine coracana subsp. coracana]